MIIGKDKTLEILKQVLNYSPTQTEAILYSYQSQTTRFANNSIHQNMLEKNHILTVKVILDKKIGISSGNLISKNSIKKIVDKAMIIAKLQKENPDFVSLPSPSIYKNVTTYFEQTAQYSPIQKAEDIKKMVKKVKGAILNGSFSTEESELGIMNSLGICAYNNFTLAELITVIMSKNNSSGYSSAISRDISEIKPIEIVENRKCKDSQDKISIEPKEYTVILEEEAVADLLKFLSYLGFGALSFQENRSFMKIGQKIFGENITIFDDGTNEEGLVMPFDFEGVAKQKVEIITNGIAKGIVYDSYTAFKENKISTGHSIQNIEIGPLPLNLFMEKGNSSIEEMILSTNYGILVTRFHYTNVVEPKEAIITGMTRDGTFLIENGKITKPIYDLRFTESIIKILNNVELISSSRKKTQYSVVPALKVNNFKFTGKTLPIYGS